MPYRLRISEEEVREELRHLGYGEVPPHIVESFRKDLLKCIKNDIKALRERRSSRAEQSTSSNQYSTSDPQPTASNQFSSSINQYLSTNDQYSSSQKFQSTADEYSTSFESSNTASGQTSSFSSSRSHSHPSLRSSELTNTSQEPSHQYSIRSYRRRRDELDGGESGYSDGSDEVSESTSSARTTASSASTSGVSSSGWRESGRVDGPRRPQDSSGARARRAPSLPTYPSRPDPVSLYHYYKAHWDQHPAPGDDPRMALRWKVRADLFYSK